ncbi:hypothetical protein BDV38DRAFT_265601 [Aspergillus pseudotamarii]|uniref:Uncharacterized protein n=1 Tax=Aspergillus pseudotamarii TaxID=132259 RepID=A0A5N6SD19_ASPPS|nr:uncharacterized protein BDV38DRAFT_265601 [Aspergillus pseudotamarii]KAE8131004.1 hypothetical protein BDV38DRAFT_265601 [Aspergillus pseudotamarii]
MVFEQVFKHSVDHQLLLLLMVAEELGLARTEYVHTNQRDTGEKLPRYIVSSLVVPPPPHLQQPPTWQKDRANYADAWKR